MDLHDRYMRTSTLDLSIVQLLKSTFKNDPFEFLHQSVKYYNAEIIKGNLSVDQLNTFRMILCCEYKFLFNSERKSSKIISNDLCLRTIENALLTTKRPQNIAEQPIVHDIIILQLTLYCKPQCIREHILHFQESNDRILCSNESKIVYMKILECFLGSLQLRKFLYNDLDTNLLEHFNSLFMENLTLWLEAKENKEWHIFISMFPKLTSTFGTDNVLPIAWNCILNKIDDLKDILSALSILIDMYFTSKTESTSPVYYTLCYMEQLWLLIIQGLKSSIHQFRKQALFIMKKVTDFLSTMEDHALKSRKPKIIPFLCNQLSDTKISMDNVKQCYFLILEALEEKQHHLIFPALKHLPVLIRGNKDHTVCNCFGNVWLQLIFVRILQHENNMIVKQGIVQICDHPMLVCNQEFLKLLIRVLNTTYLYECQSYQQEPGILKNIEILFARAKEECPEILETVFRIISEETWAPIPIFYIMKVLRSVSSNASNHWSNKQLILVKSMVQKNLHMHSRILRIASQTELLRTVTLSVDKVEDLKTAMDMLMEFPAKEAIARNSHSWNVVVEWLKKVVAKEEAVNFIRLTCREYSSETPHTFLNPAKFALTIAIFYDAGLILQNEKCAARQVLDKWWSSLRGIVSRPFANTSHIFPMIEFMLQLLNLCSMKPIKDIMELISLYINNAMNFLLKKNKNLLYKYNYEETNRYCDAMAAFFSNGKLILPEKEMIQYAEKFRNESIIVLENITQYTHTHYLCALHTLHCTQNILCPNHATFYLQPLLHICDIHISNNDKDDEIQLRGKIASDCYVLLARLVIQFLSNMDPESWPEKVDWFDSLLHLHEMGGYEIVPEIALVLKTMVDKGALKNLQCRSRLESVFSMLWRATMLSTKNKIYFLAMKYLLGIIVNNNFLALHNVMDFVNNFVDQLLEESNNLPKLTKLLLNEMMSLDLCYLRNFCCALLSCLLQGHALRRDKQIENQVYSYIAKHYENCYLQCTELIEHNIDANVRATSVVLLHKIIVEDKEYASMMIPIILQRLEQYKNKRYFSHSYVHKVKHRLMQILLIIQPVLKKEATVQLQEFLCNTILLEGNQHSVQLMQEWLLIKIFAENIELHDNFWTFFEKGITTRPGCVSSIACILYHVSKLLPANCQNNFIVSGISHLARCCLGQQYNMRLYSQIIFAKLYKMLQTANCDACSLLQYKGLYDATIASLMADLAKNSNKMQEDFYLSIFHATQHYTLQTIYFELPRLTDMDASEWITPEVFEILNFKRIPDHPLRLRNLDTSLSDTKVSSYSKKLSDDTETSANGSGTDFGELHDVQKKIIPSASINASQDTFPTIRESISHKRSLSEEEGLIVVACLIDRTPNLGGLARTCEIFNVKELIIANLNQIRDKEFQNLSVSAENWTTIIEVKPHELCKYLLNKKETGWSVVGVEQTANSTNLLNMKFEKKTVLILGNEKNGIPANLIPVFDTCIEIPQLGIIRSLNVHVSGAICIWQYVKQHTLM